MLITFGIWGGIAFSWFIAAALRVFHNNYRYGDPQLRVVNTFLYATFVGHLIVFVFIVGGLQADLPVFIGWLGLSVSLNGGMSRPVKLTETVAAVKSPGLISTMPRARPAFGRTARIG